MCGKMRSRQNPQKKTEVKYIRGYQIKGKMFLKRCVNGKVIYPSLVALSAVPINDGADYCLMLGTWSILKEEKNKFAQYNLNEKNWKLNWNPSLEENYVVISICLDGVDDSFQILAENNYRTREFLNMVDTIKIIEPQEYNA